MVEVGFYHLTRTSAEDALAPLLGRTLDAGGRAVVRCADVGRVDQVDAALWRAPEPMWLPHGTARGGEPAWQPIWITAGLDVPNDAGFLFLLDGLEAADVTRFERVFVLFDGTRPEAVAVARSQWSGLKTASHALRYWKQEPRGWVGGNG